MKHGVVYVTDLHLLCRRSLHIYGCKAVLIEPGFHQTNITSSSNVGNMYQQAWDDLQPEMKAEFGEEFLRKGWLLPNYLQYMCIFGVLPDWSVYFLSLKCEVLYNGTTKFPKAIWKPARAPEFLCRCQARGGYVIMSGTETVVKRNGRSTWRSTASLCLVRWANRLLPNSEMTELRTFECHDTLNAE